jgi:hypothetical protein
MLPRKALLPVAIAAGLVAASPAAASPPAAEPAAHAAGGGGGTPPPLPAIVRTRVTRTENALERLTESVDDGDTAKATNTAKVIRRQLSAAWRGTKYYIKNAPPPPPPADDARVHFNDDVVLHVKDLAPHVRARVSGGAPAAGTIADAPTTTIAVFQLQDDVISTIVELTDGARVPLLNEVSKTLFFALDKRDAAVEDVHTLAPPPPPPAGDARVDVHARASGGAVVGGAFDAVMPQVVGMIDDELQQIDGLQADATDLRPGAKKILRAAEVQALLTQKQVNTYWPPLPVGD